MAAHVFLAYARPDRAYAERLVDFLGREGFDVWTDRKISLGSNWARTIEHQIATSVAAIVVLSPDAERSKWVEREVIYAQSLEKPVFPIRLGSAELNALGGGHYEDASSGRMPGQSFVDALRRAVGMPVPAPPTDVRLRLVNQDATKVFVNYRRSDAAFAAHWLRRELTDWFRRDSDLAEDSFFIDVDSISLGSRFRPAVDAAIRQCQVLLAVIGDRWLSAERDGVRRLDAAEDMVRQEIELGLEHGVTIVPVIVHPAVMPDTEMLPTSIRELTEFQGMTVHAERFRDNADYLAGKLKDIIRG